MSRKSIIAAITTQPWLIQPEYVIANTGIIQKVLAGEEVFKSYDDDGAEKEKLSVEHFTVDPKGNVSFGSWRDPFANAEPGSTAVIGISGPIMKYDNCGDPGTKTYSALLTKARKNPNINSVLLVMDTPGGTVDGTQELADLVKAFSKPIVALVDGLMASAGYWIGSSADEVIANNGTAEIGSIGTMIGFADMQPYWEKQGVKFHYVYADASADKNKTFHDMQAGKYEGIKAELNKINDIFISAVKDNRPGIKETALSGKVFMAQDAIDQKLIDAIGNFDYAIGRAQTLAGNPPSTSNSQKQNMKKVTLTAAHAAILALCGATIAAGATSVDVELNDELVGKINSALEAGAKASTDLKTAQDEIAAAKTKVTETEKKVTDAEAKASKAEKDLVDFKAASAGDTKTIKTGEEVVTTSGDKEDYTTEADEKLAETLKKINGKK